MIGTEDTAHGQLHVYEGTKQADGNAFDRAGLTNGTRHVLDLVDENVSTDSDFRAAYGKGRAVEFDLAAVNWAQSGPAQNAGGPGEGADA